MSLYFRRTLIGQIGIEEKNGAISRLYLEGDAVMPDPIMDETKLIRQAFEQLELYLEGKLFKFSIPLIAEGTVFRETVWQALREIPYGTTVSYKDIAAAVGAPQAARAVGMANHKNPIPIFIPCHRVIGAKGKLVGYRGGLAVKNALLELEARNRNKKIESKTTQTL